MELFGSNYIGNYPWVIQFSPGYDAMDIPYLWSPGAMTYTAFPTKGVYLEYVPKGVRDTIDCLTAGYDTAVTFNYNASAEFAQYVTFQNQSTQENLYYMTYSSAVNTTINFPAAGAYTLGATQNDNFSVGFNGSKSTYYSVSCVNDSITFYINTLPDSNRLNPLAMITALNSKLLKGQSFGTLKVSGFGYLDDVQ